MLNARVCAMLGLCCLLWASMLDAAANPIDRIVAVVNDDVITESEFHIQLRRVRQELRTRQGNEPPREALYRQVLERMVTEKIQLQIARRLGVKVPETAVDAALQDLARKNNLKLPELRKVLARDGVSLAAFKEDVKTQLIIRRLVEREVFSRVAVSDEEVANFLAGQQGRTASGREYNVSHILIRIPESAGAEAVNQAQAKAKQALESIRDGLDFEQAAISFSEGQDALEGGKLGWRKPGQLPTLFVEAVRGLEAGEVSEILQSANGFHIIKLNETRGGGKAVVAQTLARHILIKTDEFLSAAEATMRLNRLRERILNGENFAELARVHSEDPLSSIDGGDLGWLSPGETVPNFEAAMRGLEIGEISQPFRTSFGIHVVQVLDRREQELGEELDRNNALVQIRARKSDENYERWLRQLRDESFVDYRVENL